MTAPRTSCIAHPPEDQFLIVRRSFVELLGGDHCAAALLAVFEFWGNGDLASTGQIQSRQATVRDLQEAMMGLYKERSIRAALGKLEAQGFVMIEGDAGDPAGKSFAIVPDALNQALGFETTPAKTQGGAGKNAKGVRQKRRGALHHTPHAREERKKKEGETRASAPPVDRSAQGSAESERDASGGTVAAAEIVADAQGLTLPGNARQRQAWLRGAGPLADHPAETIRAAVELKLRSEPERWRTKPLWPRFVAEDLPALLRELAPDQPQPVERPDELYDRSEIMRVCREAGNADEARTAWKARDWPAVLALYRSAKAETMGAAA